MTKTNTIADATDDLYEDIDFMEQPVRDTSGAAWGWLVAGAAVGIGALYLSHPRHGERRRTEVRDGCRKFGRDCQTGFMAQAREWRDRMIGKASDFQAEIRNHAPPYLQ